MIVARASVLARLLNTLMRSTVARIAAATVAIASALVALARIAVPHAKAVATLRTRAGTLPVARIALAPAAAARYPLGLWYGVATLAHLARRGIALRRYGRSVSLLVIFTLGRARAAW